MIFYLFHYFYYNKQNAFVCYNKNYKKGMVHVLKYNSRMNLQVGAWFNCMFHMLLLRLH